MKPGNRRTLYRTTRLVVAAAFVLTLSAFRHTEVETHANPNFANYTFDAVYVQIPDVNSYFRDYLTERLAKEFRKSDVRMYTSDDLFSPFQEWTEEDKKAVLARHGVDSTIVITLESEDQRASPGMVFFDADLGTATHVQARSDRSVFHVRLIDLGTSELAWAGILRTRGNGTLFTGDKSTAKAVSKHVADSLRESGHLPK